MMYMLGTSHVVLAFQLAKQMRTACLVTLLMLLCCCQLRRIKLLGPLAYLV